MKSVTTTLMMAAIFGLSLTSCDHKKEDADKKAKAEFKSLFGVPSPTNVRERNTAQVAVILKLSKVHSDWEWSKERSHKLREKIVSMPQRTPNEIGDAAELQAKLNATNSEWCNRARTFLYGCQIARHAGFYQETEALGYRDMWNWYDIHPDTNHSYLKLP
jgi:hypothetical protein